MNEKELLQIIKAISQRTGFTGSGDDAAVLKSSSQSAATSTVVSTDQFIENTHFTWQQMSPFDVGYKGTVQALSDLAAMAAAPQALLCSVAWPATQNKKIVEVFKGIEKACLDYQTPLVGGDITRSQAEQTYLDFTVIGQSAKPVLQSGAKHGDILAVSGPIGSSLAGFRCLKENIDSPLLVAAFRQPKAQIQKALTLNAQGLITSMTDISDSLSQCLFHLSEQSQCGFHIELEKIPRTKDLERLCTEHSWPLKHFLLYGGEDYELLLTLPNTITDQQLLDHGLTAIGQAYEGPNTFSENKKTENLQEVGWDPFIL